MDSKIRSYINIGSLIVVLVINYLSNTIPFNNLTQEDISDLFPVLITPEGYVFSIWGLIYLLLIGFVIYQALPKYREQPFVRAVGILFALTSLFNVIWLIVWHHLQILLSLIILVFLLITLILIYQKISKTESKATILDKVFVKLPFSLYLGWITVAILANFNILLNDIEILGTSGFGAILFTILMIVLGGVVALYVFYLKQDYAFALVYVWAYIGIGVRHGSDQLAITLTAWMASVAIIFYLGWIKARLANTKDI
ncbi:tryptophan-rich sensory protein [Natranaerobius trueperi]|uniref:Lantibiotic ABC transporter permease n=1 Tax=Natranaerobius trueperi TaxID=759412 RepID=A0A226BXE5_9FIRM|nr:tryptophan-rich sensory protein [Natranaerobius trueperi]OWZ83004.1 hypothetical protein CDO51_10920 [Natranaerobius trueperi]